MGTSNVLNTKFYGFRVYAIIKDGPIDLFNRSNEKNKIVELEDFFIPSKEYEKDFALYLNKNKNIPTEFEIYNIKTRSFRTIILTPKDGWGNSKSLIGANVRYENWAVAHKNVLRVIKVNENSPLKENLIPGDDFVIALRKKDHEIISLNQEEKDPLSFFSDSIEAMIGEEIQIFVYNIVTKYKSFYIKLLKKENGEILGCDLAYGSLHEFPQEITLNNENSEIKINQN